MQFIKEAYGQHWLCWAHDAEDPDEPPDSGHPGGGFTMRRRVLT